ncbi:hypothetical protein B0T13DRAFT_488717 [Neurospora crassa]|nr:hypothetical protein B0T13DRAFT_492091 [Neurospora crassa]KAK3498643.1 hypothetical protein B0T13DRAFT_488717 [Neurospora crassa]
MATGVSPARECRCLLGDHSFSGPECPCCGLLYLGIGINTMAVKSPDGHRMTPVILPRSVVSDKGMTCEAVGALASPWQCAARGAGAGRG